jgi:uncharacterized membrane protein YdbT with pleckstrin-like domain
MASDPHTADAQQLAATDRMGAGAELRHRSESGPIWSSSEGQVSNLGAFAAAVLLCWLVVPVVYAAWRYLRTACHRYELTDQRLLERSGIVVKRVEALELYRVKDMSVSGTLAQSLFGRGRITLQTSDTSSPSLLINAVANPEAVSQMLREAVERCRAAKGVRAFDF